MYRNIKHQFVRSLTFAAVCSVLCTVAALSAAAEVTLKYANAGTLNGWTEESYYNSPVVTDLDGDGAKEIVFSNYSITVLDAATGNVRWKVNSGHDRSEEFAESGKNAGHTWCDAVVKDIDGDGSNEIVTVHGNGLVSVLDKNGCFKPGWPQNPEPGVSARSVKAEDLDGDGTCEIVVGYGKSVPYNQKTVYVFEHDGSIRQGWPQLASSDLGWCCGVYMNGILVTDLDGDGTKEIIVPSDLASVSAFYADGRQVKASESVYGGAYWGDIPLYEDQSEEIKRENGIWGWDSSETDTREVRYRAEFGHAVAAAGDLDGDGVNEIVLSAIICDRYPFEQSRKLYAEALHTDSKYMTLAVLRPDRTRYVNQALGADWSRLPVDLGAPLAKSDESLALGVCATPVIADLDGDGLSEILLNTYDGKLHCFSVNKTEPYAFPFSLTKRTNPLLEYATPPVCVDLDFDGKKEVIFASRYDENQPFSRLMQGSLYILNYEGKLLSKTPLPPAKEVFRLHNGAMSAPVVTEIDGDGRYEAVVNTINGAVCVYDLDI